MACKGRANLATIELFATGDEIGTYTDFRISGKSNGTKLTLEGVTPLGSASDAFRIVISGVADGDSFFDAGQTIEIYAYPDTDPPGDPIYTLDIPAYSDFNGRASSFEHQVVPDGTGGGLIIDIDGLTPGDVQYGPGNVDPLTEVFEFTSLSPDPPSIPCFVKGTLIETESGPLPVECLRVGDLVRTLDHGNQPIRWIGRRTVSGHDTLAPIRVDAGALGNHRPLLVSPQHRLLLSDWRTEVLFGQSQVLVAAKHLVDGRAIRPVPRPRVTYLHFTLDRHEVVFAEGLATESLYLGDMALAALDRAARDELAAIFPELAGLGTERAATARPCLSGWEGQLLSRSSATGVLSPAA